MKNFISLFTTLCIMLTMLGTFTVFAEEAADLEISTLAELEAFRDDVNSGNTYEGKTVKLTADIDMSEEYGEGKESWTPIGIESWENDINNTFLGTFDGDNHTISGFYAYTEERYGVASFFLGIYETVENLNIKGTVIGNHPSDCSVAGIAVCVSENAQMLNCSFEGLVKNPNYAADGLAGANDGLISNCRFKGKVEGEHLVAGIAGTGGGTITNCLNEGEIIGTFPVGGIAGWGQTIKNCINKGSVTGRTYVSTYTDYESGEEITECYASNEVGGIAGVADNGAVVENCYNTGAVSGNNEVGGILGVANVPWEGENILQVKNCYNIGNVTSTMEKDDGEHNIGAIIGSREYNYTEDGENFTKVLTSEAVDCCYLSGTADRGCGGIAEDTAKAITSEQFADKSNFRNWDFEMVWKMDETLGRPVLRSNTEELPVQPHMHMLVHHEAVSATCTKMGNREYWQCSVCGNVFEDEEATRETDGIPSIDINSSAHSWGAWNITAKPTLTTTGTAECICTENSNHKDTFTLPILTDTTVWTESLKIEPTETERGLAVYTSQYGEIKIIIPPLNTDCQYSIKYENGKAVVTVPENGTYTVIFAAYDTQSRLLSVNVKNVLLIKGENEPIEPQKFNASDKVKVMLWDSAKAMKPLCAAYEN